jgi:hypothetical protein
LGIFHGVPATKKSVFDLSVGPAHIVLYQKNIEPFCDWISSARVIALMLSCVRGRCAIPHILKLRAANRLPFRRHLG